ncbi:hypothetical protein LTR22_026642 [Elasticomyces elasticus]|nr:hypothetical protein LTR22_026642 [Elasticomyces elasticus]KAK4907941.1 hypothetical protein LTR49_023090 [Elasticomyces elasticus]KAK5748124.1 hypothetical protein LTS12_021816 [Elasticomyces elasticus]
MGGNANDSRSTKGRASSTEARGTKRKGTNKVAKPKQKRKQKRPWDSDDESDADYLPKKPKRPISYAKRGQPNQLCILPAEIRNDIWSRVLPEATSLNPLCARHNTIAYVSTGSFRPKLPHIVRAERDDERSKQSAPPLLKVCRLLKSDARLMAIARTTFVFDLFCPSDIDAFKRWWDFLGPDVQHIRSFRIDRVKAMGPNRSLPCRVEHFVTMAPFANQGRSVTVSGTTDDPRPGSTLVATMDAMSLEIWLGGALAARGWPARSRAIHDAVASFVQTRGYDLSWPALLP